MSKWLCWIGIHDWVIMMPVFRDRLALILDQPDHPPERTCKRCGKHQTGYTKCVNFVPARFIIKWIKE